ncbi:glycoside hydrolase family 30 protein [Spirosoma rhododendri]|uniref:Glycoside hydrolase family 30 protein n=1 Tax=Spirosoma rhododendri TaxID=2728024 RepID=A0A7L5DKZ2_9BACT|nr:glycoside hydrolase family 30 protein [Spirosoma rhododendri]QJD78755.1 glycoside hydrolase family 30 protein [Spirosoma rhododendri]
MHLSFHWLTRSIGLFIGSYFLTTSTGCQGQPQAPATLVVNPAQTFQRIDHFGASDAWSCQFVGQWPDAKRNAIADLLFSRDTLTNGNPIGIGLSIWRFNVGAGTTEQGSASGIRDEWRRAESFLNTDGTYDWNKQAGQRWFLQAAKRRGVASFLAFTNSPPVQYTINGKGFATNKIPNLAPDRYDQFARFLTDVTTGVGAKTGVTFNYISPVNEPQWDWSDGGQEGTPFYNKQIAGITRSLSKQLQTSQLPAKTSIAEAGQLDFLVGDNKKPGQGQQIQSFFDKASPDYVGDLPTLVRAVSAHSYFTTSPYAKAAETRQQIRKTLNGVADLGYWMSEYCILGDNDGEINGSGKGLGIDPAVYVAKVIHNDLVNANASAWHWWLAISPYDYKDGLIYIDKNKTDGAYQPSKMLWALGNYSRFIRPGAVRIDATLPQNTSNLLVSAYQNTDRKLVIVVINTGTDSQLITPVLASGQPANLAMYTTSATTNLSPSARPKPGTPLTILGRSIVTLVGDLPK